MKNEIFINQMQLLSTIFHTDPKKTGHGILCVYDMWEDERLVAIFSNSKDCAEFMGIKQNSIDCNVCKGYLVRFRYKLVRVGKKRDEYE